MIILEAAAVAMLDAAVHGGYAVDLGVLDSAARAFQQTSDSLGALGLPSPSALTAGSDTHSALALVVTGALNTAATSLSSVGGRLRTMAENYRHVEAVLTQALESIEGSAADGLGPTVPVLIPGARPATGVGRAEPAGGWEAAGTAMLLGASAAHDAPGLTPTPHIGPENLRAAAAGWFAAAGRIDDHHEAAAAAAGAVTAHCSGPAVEAFREKTVGLFSSRPSRGETVAAGDPLMDQLSACCRLLARAHDAAAEMF